MWSVMLISRRHLIEFKVNKKKKSVRNIRMRLMVVSLDPEVNDARDVTARQYANQTTQIS